MDNRSSSFWEITYRQNIARMIGVCCRYTQNRETAEDLAHDAFLVAIDKVSTFENRGPFEAWLRRIVVNVALQYLREQKKQQKLNEVPAYHGVFDDFQDENLANDNSAFSEAELLEVIGLLPEHHRLVFNLYVVDNFTHAQIAAQLGISEGTSKSHLARARKKIKELLNNKLKANKDRKRALPLFIFSDRIWSVDRLVSKKLNRLAIRPERSHEKVKFNDASMPKFRATGISNNIVVKAGISAIAAAVILTDVSKLPYNTYQKESPITIPELTVSMPDSASSSDSISETINKVSLFDSIPATIPDNPIIVEKTKNLEQMKNLETLGGLLLAGLALDTTGLSMELPIPLKNQQVTATNHVLEPKNAVESIKPTTKQNSKPISGTFYASKLLWSEENNTLFLMGDRVKVDLKSQKFSGSGKFSFVDQISYLVVDNTPAKLNETIELTDKKYRIAQLNESDGFKKYGDKGKLGVVEIYVAK